MKNIRTLVALSILSVFLAGTASATTSSVNPNVPAQNSPLSSSVLRGNFGAAYNDINVLFGIDTLSSNQLLGTVNSGMAGGLNLPSCASGALSWTPGSGFGCNSLSGLISPVTQALVFTGVVSFDLNTTTLPVKQVGTTLQVGNADGVASRIENDAFGAPAYFTGIRSDGTNASPTTLQSGDEIAGFNAWGYNGSSIVGPRASVRAYAAQNWTGSAQGTYLSFLTALNGTTTPAEVCRFENDGGMTCPATVTGGSQGAGRINAAGLYVNGVAVSTGNSSLSALTAALGANSIENGANAQTWNFDSLTTGNALTLSSTSITTGELLNVSAANAGGSGYAGYFSNSGASTSYGIYVTDATTGSGYGVYSTLTGAANSGYAIYGNENVASNTGYAGYFSNTGTGVAYGVYATEGGAANTGYAGYFSNTSTAGYGVYVAGTAKFTKTAIGAAQSLSLTSTTFTPDMTQGNDWKMSLVHATCPCAVANPANEPAAGTVNGVIKIIQSSTGSDTVTWGSQYKFAGGSAPTLSTGASNPDYFSYHFDASDSTIVVSAGVLNAH